MSGKCNICMTHEALASLHLQLVAIYLHNLHLVERHASITSTLSSDVDRHESGHSELHLQSC